MSQTEMIKLIPWIALFLLVFAFAAILHKRFKERSVWGNLIKRYKDNTEHKLLSEAEFVTRFGAIENNSLIYKMDRLVLTSGAKNIFPWMSGETLLIGMMLAAVAGFFEGNIIAGNVLVAIFLMVAQAVAVYAFFKALSGKTYNQIEDGIAIFISILCNHAKGSSDIVTIMNNTIPALTGPLKGIVEKFVSDAENTGNVDIAFDYMKESVDNRQLQTIIVNLKNCMHYQANYEEVLVQMMGQIAAGLSAREDRKNILFSSKLTLTVISIMAVVIVWIIGAGLGIDVKGSLTGNLFGQILLLITGLLYLMVGVKMFGTDK